MINRPEEIGLLLQKLKRNPAVVILGARQIGKTTLAQEVLRQLNIGARYFDLESQNTLAAIQSDPESFLKLYKDDLIVIDEIQIYPALFAILRSVIDLDRRPGRYIILGSANPQLVRGVSESLAGRVSYYELPHLRLDEVGFAEQMRHWYRGGFPPAYLAEDDTAFQEWTQDYIRAYAERDINLLFGVNLNTIIIRRLWTMLASLSGTTLNLSNLSRSLGVSVSTVSSYIDILEAAFLIYKLRPWYTNIGKRLIKTPKVYIADTGLLHGLLRIQSPDDLYLHPIVGASWEGYVVQQIKAIVKDHFELYFYRTSNGAEIDLVLVHVLRPVISIEIKNSNRPNVSKGFYSSIEDLQTKHNYVLTRDTTNFNIKGVQIIGLGDFLKDELPNLMKNN